jgi:apolipoprotein N-acyltransferase
VRVAGIQLEFPKEGEVLAGLDQLVAAQPDANLLVLSEYTLDGPVPPSIAAWCQKHQRYLVLGGKDPVAGAQYFDTAFVLGPTGEIVFRQAKSVPVQLMDDGLPATQQAVWASPWGRIGFCICYDLSYTRVTDELIRQGAQLLVVPTMDVAGWGLQEHRTNGRVAPVRAPEYGVPVFRLASSGISEAVDAHGRFLAQAAYPGQRDILAAGFVLPKHGSLPLDRWLAPFCVFLVALLIVLHLVWGWIGKRPRRGAPAPVS